MLLTRMLRVIKIDVERVSEDAGSFLERNSVLLKITPCLCFIPLIIHEMKYSIWAFNREIPLDG